MNQIEQIQSPMEDLEKLIIVTGFGPFEGHEEVNASWEAVRMLPDKLDFNGTVYCLHKQEISVEYEAVDKAIDEIWKRKPELVIHCGVHGSANCVYLEKQAVNHRFKKPDNAGRCLPNCSAVLSNTHEDKDFIRCGLNVDRIVKTIEQTCSCSPNMTDTTTGSTAKASYNVGDFLCCYIYLRSLDIDNSRTLFVHVPPVDKPFSSKETSEIILQIINECLRQLVVDLIETC